MDWWCLWFIWLRIFYAEQARILKELITIHPLDKKDIARIFKLSDLYIILCVQTHVRRCGLVFYNTVNRDGAVEEAEVVLNGLHKAGFHTQMIEWKSAYNLIKTIEEEPRKLPPESLSLLEVSIISHGKTGMIAGENNSLVQITDVLFCLEEKLPAELPLVCSH